MVMVTTMILYLAIYFEVARMLQATLPAFVSGANAGAGQSAAPLFTGLKLRILLILSGGVIVCGVLGYIWLSLAARQISRPVRTISKAISKLARGQLNDTVTIETSDEFGQIGAGINELAANLQELLLYIWKQTGQCLSLLEYIQNNPDLRHDRRLTLESLGYLKQLAESIDDLREMAKAYVFYDVSIEGTNTHAIKAPGESDQVQRAGNDVKPYISMK